MNLKEYLEEYKNITIKLIDTIKQDDDFSELLSKRESIAEIIEKLEFTQEEFKELYIELGILNLEEKLQQEIKKEQKRIKEKINYIKVTRNARNKYENAQIKPNFFNKKG